MHSLLRYYQREPRKLVVFLFSPLSPFRFVSCVYLQCACSLEVVQKAVRALGDHCGGHSDAAVLSWLCSKQGQHQCGQPSDPYCTHLILVWHSLELFLPSTAVPLLSHFPDSGTRTVGLLFLAAACVLLGVPPLPCRWEHSEACGISRPPGLQKRVNAASCRVLHSIGSWKEVGCSIPIPFTGSTVKCCILETDPASKQAQIP